jgi:hypothetical protein
MIQRCKRPRFAIETRQALTVRRDRIGQYFDRNFASEVGIVRALVLTHATDPDLIDDFIRTEPCARGERHESPPIIAIRVEAAGGCRSTEF